MSADASGAMTTAAGVTAPPSHLPSDQIIEETAETEDGPPPEVFSKYVCHSLDFGNEHPGQVAEPAGLALVPLPPAEFPLRDSLPSGVVEEGKLSCLQLEGVLYACQRHRVILPNGSRAGFFLGDGAGVGKGRQISGVILDSWARGRRQHVWLSTSRDLKLDADRDLSDLGMHGIKVIDGCQELDDQTRAFGLSKDFKEGVLFLTYATLIGSGGKGKKSRADQIVEWCGGEAFDGALILDECHKAKNFVIGDADASTKTSKCVIELQTKMPKARVVYSSATGVTELGNLAYCERLGMWGPGSPFSDFESFHKTVSKRGVFFLEMLSMELKRAGAYVSRGLSFNAAEFMTVEVALAPEQIAIYDEACRAWHETRVALVQALEATNTKSRAMTAYWGAHQRFFRQLCVSFKVERVCEEAQQALKEGHAIVIGLQTTGAAGLDRRLSAGTGAGSAFISSARECALYFIDNNFPTVVQADEKAKLPGTGGDVEILDDGGAALAGAGAYQGVGHGDILSASHTPLKDLGSSALGRIPPGQPVPQCVEAKQALIERFENLRLPHSALDMFIDRLGGPANVAEMTGRMGRLERGANGRVSYVQRGKGDAEVERINVSECKRFQAGEKLVAIISDAASTGISLHADARSGNTRRRMHFTVELPWSADKAVQQLGRSHRSNAATAPIYKLVVTELGGERRFASAVARRLESLGALTKGDRRAAAGQDLQEFNLQTVYGKDALKKVLEQIELSYAIVQSGALHSSALSSPSAQLKAAGVEPGDLCEIMGVRSVDDLFPALHDALNFIGMGSAGRKEKDLVDVKKFLGRLLGLPVAEQNTLYHYFFCVLQHAIAVAVREGKYSDQITDLFGADYNTVTLESTEEVYRDSVTGSNCSTYRIKVDRGINFERASAMLSQALERENLSGKDCGKDDEAQAEEAAPKYVVDDSDQAAGKDAVSAPREELRVEQDGDAAHSESRSKGSDVDGAENTCQDPVKETAKEALMGAVREAFKPRGHRCTSGFYRSRRDVPGRGRPGWILAVDQGDHTFRVVRPNSGVTQEGSRGLAGYDLNDKYLRCDSEEEVRRCWSRDFDESLTWDRGEREVRVDLICGSLVPLWNQIENVVMRIAASAGSAVTARDAGMKVVRIRVDGKTLVGLRLPAGVMHEVKRQLAEYALVQSGKIMKVVPPYIMPQTIAAMMAGSGTATVQVAVAGRGMVPSLLRLDRATLKLTMEVEHPDGPAAGWLGCIPVPMMSLAPISVQIPGSKSDESPTSSLEDVAPVNSKDLQRGMSKPKNIMSFFAAAPKTAASASSDTSAPFGIGGKRDRGGAQETRAGARPAASAGKQVAPASKKAKTGAGIAGLFAAQAVPSTGGRRAPAGENEAEVEEIAIDLTDD